MVEEDNRIGVFICHCGLNIAGTVDIEGVRDSMKDYPGVVHSTDYTYMCSDPGQNLFENDIKDYDLNGAVVAACTPNLHEDTFRKAAIRAGLNQFRVEIANIREKCSWVHEKDPKTTDKATKIVKSMVEKVKQNDNLKPVNIPVTNKALIIGAGVAGIQTSIDLAEMGYEVILVEKEPTIGGHMAQLSETFPTLDCSQCILTPKMVQASKHENIKMYTYSEVVDISGYVGNFKVKIKKKPRYVDPDTCKLCSEQCEPVCPQIGISEFEMNLTERKAIYMPFPQAVPATMLIDEELCLNGQGSDEGLKPIRCTKCFDACEPLAINFDMKPEFVVEKVGAIVLATGYDQYDISKIKEYGAGKIPDVITGLEFERLLSAGGPTAGKVLRPSDHQVPKEVVFIQCSGSRDPEHHKPYCSKICCMYTAKHTLLYKHKVPDGQAYVFYIDIRTPGKDYEEFVNRVMEEDRVLYLRGKVSKIAREGDKNLVFGVDTLTGKPVKINADLVVLAQAIEPSKDTSKITTLTKTSIDIDGWAKEAHPKLRPVESLTAGIFLAGTVQGPKDIPETVSQASAAASKVAAVLSHEELMRNPETSFLNEELCTACANCEPICPYSAITINENKKLAEINMALCEGCGMCSPACPSGAISLINMTENQIGDMIVSMIRR